MSGRYEIQERPPTELARKYGMDYAMFVVWDTELDKSVPFGRFRTRERAETHIARIEAREKGTKRP